MHIFEGLNSNEWIQYFFVLLAVLYERWYFKNSTVFVNCFPLHLSMDFCCNNVCGNFTSVCDRQTDRVLRYYGRIKLAPWSVADPGFPVGECQPVGGTDLRCGCFLVETYAKAKELGPVRGAEASVRQWWSYSFSNQKIFYRKDKAVHFKGSNVHILSVCF